MGRTVIAILAVMLSCPVAVRASPEVSLDDPIYFELARLRALGRLPAYLGGVQPLTELRVAQLLAEAAGPAGGAAIGPGPRGWWLRPLARVVARLVAYRDRLRPYSTGVRPRDVAGAVALSCEREEGRPCGPGLGAATELDSSVGRGQWLSASTRLRATAGSDAYAADVAVDRATVEAELGPVALEVGRDVLVLGPASRTQLAWGDSAPPLDAVRLGTARPLDLVGERGSVLRASVFYAVGRLRAPQTFPGNLVSIGRLQLDVADEVELGMTQLLQLGGEGAPGFGPWDFLAEHVRRRDATAGPDDSSNRRLGLDLAVRVDRLRGARFYYALMFEDGRRQVLDALRFDADHLLGVELAAIGPGRRHALVLELLQTGVRSHEHSPRTTGLTQGGRIVGSPLGPDARSGFAGARIAVGPALLLPWIELVRLSSDTYRFVVDGGISRVGAGVAEDRYRAGGRVIWPLGCGVEVDAEAMLEHVGDAAFAAGARRNNAGVALALAWAPPASARSWRP